MRHRVTGVQRQRALERGLRRDEIALVVVDQPQRRVCLGKVGCKFQRTLGGGQRVCDRTHRRHVAVIARAQQRVCVGKARVRESISGVMLDGLLEVGHRAFQRCLCALVKMVAAEQVEIVSVDILRRRRLTAHAPRRSCAGRWLQ